MITYVKPGPDAATWCNYARKRAVVFYERVKVDVSCIVHCT